MEQYYIEIPKFYNPEKVDSYLLNEFLKKARIQGEKNYKIPMSELEKIRNGNILDYYMLLFEMSIRGFEIKGSSHEYFLKRKKSISESTTVCYTSYDKKIDRVDEDFFDIFDYNRSALSGRYFNIIPISFFQKHKFEVVMEKFRLMEFSTMKISDFLFDSYKNITSKDYSDLKQIFDIEDIKINKFKDLNLSNIKETKDFVFIREKLKENRIETFYDLIFDLEKNKIFFHDIYLKQNREFINDFLNLVALEQYKIIYGLEDLEGYYFELDEEIYKDKEINILDKSIKEVCLELNAPFLLNKRNLDEKITTFKEIDYSKIRNRDLLESLVFIHKNLGEFKKKRIKPKSYILNKNEKKELDLLNEESPQTKTNLEVQFLHMSDNRFYINEYIYEKVYNFTIGEISNFLAIPSNKIEKDFLNRKILCYQGVEYSEIVNIEFKNVLKKIERKLMNQDRISVLVRDLYLEKKILEQRREYERNLLRNENLYGEDYHLQINTFSISSLLRVLQISKPLNIQNIHFGKFVLEANRINIINIKYKKKCLMDLKLLNDIEKRIGFLGIKNIVNLLNLQKKINQDLFYENEKININSYILRKLKNSSVGLLLDCFDEEASLRKDEINFYSRKKITCLNGFYYKDFESKKVQKVLYKAVYFLNKYTKDYDFEEILGMNYIDKHDYSIIKSDLDFDVFDDLVCYENMILEKIDLLFSFYKTKTVLKLIFNNKNKFAIESMKTEFGFDTSRVLFLMKMNRIYGFQYQEKDKFIEFI